MRDDAPHGKIGAAIGIHGRFTESSQTPACHRPYMHIGPGQLQRIPHKVAIVSTDSPGPRRHATITSRESAATAAAAECKAGTVAAKAASPSTAVPDLNMYSARLGVIATLLPVPCFLQLTDRFGGVDFASRLNDQALRSEGRPGLVSTNSRLPAIRVSRALMVG